MKPGHAGLSEAALVVLETPGLHPVRVSITTIDDLEADARPPAEQLTRLLTGYEATGEEPLRAIFEWALERLSSDDPLTEPWPLGTRQPETPSSDPDESLARD